MTIENRLKAEAERLGFFLSGITTAEPPVSFPRFSNWIKNGYFGGMDYLAAPRSLAARADPRQLLAECQSILVLGMPYPPPGRYQPPKYAVSPFIGKVASYAWGADYHNIILPRLETLAGWLQHQLGIDNFYWKSYTDTGPLMEHDLAQRAGLGWIGRNTNLINPYFGSHFFLSEILLPVPFQPDEPFTSDHCGDCQRCIQACPTGCILPDHTIDASRCISYLTIENKGEIPNDMRSQMDNWVFGCDVCQFVCPWNKKGNDIEIDPVFLPQTTGPDLDLHQVFRLTPQAFNQLYRNRPISRTKRRGLLRNCAVALGNTPHYESIPILEKVITNEFEPLVRRHAAWALGNISDQAARRALEAAQTSEQDPGVLMEINLALSGRSLHYGSHAGK